MVQVMEKIAQVDEFAARYLGFAPADSGGLAPGGPVSRLARRDGDPPGRRREFQLVAGLDSG
jgi:hypothetical protein